MSNLTPAEQETYALLKKLEDLGGADGYLRNPQAFDAVLPNVLMENIDHAALKLNAIDKFLLAARDPASPIFGHSITAFERMLDSQLSELTIESRILKILQAMARLGGVQGFLSYLQNKTSAKPEEQQSVVRPADSGSESGWETCFVCGVIFDKALRITIFWFWGDVHADGEAWGEGLGEANVTGWCRYAPAKRLTATLTDFTIKGSAGEIVASSTIDDDPIAYIEAKTEGEGKWEGFKGWLQWYTPGDSSGGASTTGAGSKSAPVSKPEQGAVGPKSQVPVFGTITDTFSAPNLHQSYTPGAYSGSVGTTGTTSQSLGPVRGSLGTKSQIPAF